MQGYGITITFASGFLAEILDVKPPAHSRESVELTHAGTTKAKEFEPEKLYDAGEMSVDIAFDPSVSPPIDADPETVTITYPDGSTWAFEGFMTNYEPSVPIGAEQATASVTIKVSGEVTIS
jgi:hypothetical protein